MDTTNISKTEAYSKIWRPIFSSGCTVGFLILMGSTRVIQWMESPLTKEGILFASLFIGTAATFGSRLANSSDLEKYSKIVSIGGAMLGSIALLYFASVFVNYANLEI